MENENTKSKISKFFSAFNRDEDEELEYDGDYDYDDGMQEEENYISQKPMRQSVKSVRSDSSYMPEVNAEVLVVEPEFLDDAPAIVNKIKESKTVVVNLKNTEYEDGRKIFDFLNGAVFALEGSINKIAESVFILAPKQVYVSAGMDKGDDDNITPILEYEDN